MSDCVTLASRDSDRGFFLPVEVPIFRGLMNRSIVQEQGVLRAQQRAGLIFQNQRLKVSASWYPQRKRAANRLQNGWRSARYATESGPFVTHGQAVPTAPAHNDRWLPVRNRSRRRRRGIDRDDGNVQADTSRRVATPRHVLSSSKFFHG